jgi:multidrug efflux pump subunit AcrB
LISRFFIDRPIFAAVLSIVITLAGGIALWVMPVAMYPPISPPTVALDCTYPGASAQVVSETVATPIEQQVNGVENMLYMSSQCTNDGSYNLTVTFKHGVDLNLAQVLVQNRVALALPLLPDVIKQSGVTVRKMSPDILMAVALNSPPPNNRYDQLFLSNYALIRLKDELARLPGVSDVRLFGQRDYSMRIWVDPEKLAARNMTAGDVVAAVRIQNAQIPTGQIGQPPAPPEQPIQVPLATVGRLVDVEQFENIVVKSAPDGRIVKLKDVARVALGAKNEDIAAKVNGVDSVSLAVFQLPDANALETADIVKAKIAELEKDFPPGMRTEIRYDTTPYIRESIEEVFKTLREAVILVALVVLLFLQNWRSAVIPLVAVPVAIIGAFAVLLAFGFNLNNLTLFGLVLAIGIVVDDAIVVVEAVEHHIERGMPPRAATIRAMEEVSGPVIAIGLVLSAVFVPCAFISGIVGQFFRQFALTIAASTIISTFNSLTLSPALAALLLKPKEEGSHGEVLPRFFYVALGGWLGWEFLAPVLGDRYGTLAGLTWLLPLGAAVVAAAAAWVLSWPVNWLLGGSFSLFHKGFVGATGIYTRLVGGLLRVSFIVLVVYGGLLGLTYWAFNSTPTGFIPSQDMGYLMCNVQLPDSASAERTRTLTDYMERIAHENPGVKHTQGMSGMSLLLSANGSNFGSMFVILKPFAERPNPILDRFFAWFNDSVDALDSRVEGLYEFLKDPKVKRPTTWRTLLDRGQWQPRTVPIPFRERLVAMIGPSEHPAASYVVLFNRLRKTIDPQALERTVRRWLRQPKQPSQSGEAVAADLRNRFAEQIPGAIITVLGPPPVRGVGRAGGFKIMIEDRGDNGPDVLQGQTEALNDELKAQRELVGMTSVFRANVPQIDVKVDRKECVTKEVALSDLYDTMRIYLGSLYVNDFNRFGRTWQVIVQAEDRFRVQWDDVRRLKVRNSQGSMVPLGTVCDVRVNPGPLVLTRYNMYPAAPLNGAAAPGISSGESISLVEAIARDKLLPSMSTEWTELAYLEIQAGNTAMKVFGFAVVMVFLVLAAQYESWGLPLAVILVVPMCLFSAVTGIKLAYMDINIFPQIGFVVLVGLASKNAILIVEFAKARREHGETRRQAALDACGLRFRPIVMTSMAFVLGVLPLILSQGAGAEMRRTLGITVFTGMLGVTAFGIFLTPVFFAVVDHIGSLSIFKAKPVRWASQILLAALTFGILWLVFRLLEKKAKAAAAMPLKTNNTEPPAPVDHGNLVEKN